MVLDQPFEEVRERSSIATAVQRGGLQADALPALSRARAPSGSRTDSPGIRRGVVQRAHRTEKRSCGCAQMGGFDAADFARRADTAGGDVTAAVHPWLVETGRIRADAQILHLEIRTWRPR
ncbi:hypothetical protein GCM10010521_61960 [Streptomyces rameus]|uniref:Uncharacterized protein n=1 Tax=Streptomyces rameus TaxID=68261 RepID=A0ABN3V2C1_9ACTN